MFFINYTCLFKFAFSLVLANKIGNYFSLFNFRHTPSSEYNIDGALGGVHLVWHSYKYYNQEIAWRQFFKASKQQALGSMQFPEGAHQQYYNGTMVCFII